MLAADYRLDRSSRQRDPWLRNRRQKHTGRRLNVPARTEQLDIMLAFSGLAIPKKHVQLPASSQRTRRSGAIAQQVRALAQKGHYKSADEILHTLDRAPRGYSPLPDDEDKGTFCRQAVALLQLARTHGVKREIWMYERVLDGLMLQGQYVEAALLFDMLAKDWQVHRALEEAFSTPVSPPSQIISSQRIKTIYFVHHPRSLVSPALSSLLRRILNPVKEMFRRIKTFRYLPTHAVHSSLQAYVILLTTLHQRQIPYADISLLIEAVSACPVNSRVRKNPVWVVRQEGDLRGKLMH
ncbi:hypothetical protein IMY05_C4791000200 [Salix suchowensis]|nr:hypothetical protein IMY05_C4791000200 [Salix suchowensis]